MTPILRRGQALALFLMAAPAVSALAAESSGWPEGQLLAGEIIMQAPDSGAKGVSRAAEQRSRARAQRQDKSDTVGVEALEDELEGILSPRSVQPVESATELRQRARDYQQGSGSNIVIQSPAGSGAGGGVGVPGEMSTHDRAAENLAKARRYGRGENYGFTGKVGADGLPLIKCDDVGSAVARIGDDTAGSGALITVMRNGRAIKARCE